MTELAHWQAGPLEAVPQSTEVTFYDPTGGRLESWARSMVAAKQIADALCTTTFAPAHFRGKPNDGAAAIMFGDEIGLTPTQSLRSIHVIAGTPGLYARQMVALVLSHGHQVWTEKDTPEQVVVCGRRKGSDKVERSDWTTARARRAGYTSNKKYETDPQAMLYARASSDICRRVAPDALAGLAYTVEEMELEDSPRTSRTVKRTQAEVVPMPEPDLEQHVVEHPDGAREVVDGPADPSSPPESPLLNTGSRLAKRMFALFGEAGIPDRADRLAYVSRVVGREVTSSTQMTDQDAERVIDYLSAHPPGQAPPEPQGAEPDLDDPTSDPAWGQP